MSLLDESTVVSYLDDLGLASRGAVAKELGGGVSNVVLAVRDGSTGLVVKQALPRLRVAEEWLASTDRVLTEADALEFAGRLTPEAVPAVLHRDPDRHVIAIGHAPAAWRDWKSILLDGRVDDQVAGRLGEVLAAWHSSTVGGKGLPSSVRAGAEAFDQLRVDPFYRTIALGHPELAGRVLALVDAMAERQRCLVHGDFSPKNILVGDDGLWVIDFEVAHYGDPAFDLAFMLCHLTLKALHHPQHSIELDRCAVTFAQRYERGVGTELAPDWPYVLQHVGCLVLARVGGKSPAPYLTDAERDAAWRVGLALLEQRPRDVRDLCTVRDEATR
jgi:aminoglycoside phosphotransferase (APT) family kinase protein